MIYEWFNNNFIEIFGAVAGIIYVFLEIRQNLWLWPVGIVTSAVYIWVFFTGKLYADTSLQVYYLAISIYGWFWWLRGNSRTGIKDTGHHENLPVTKLKMNTAVALLVVFVLLYFIMWFILSRFTDSPVPGLDSFITSGSVIATWMLARKIFEHWLIWIIVNFVAMGLFLSRGLYPTVILYAVYGVMSFAGLFAWRRTIKDQNKLESGN